MIGVIYCDIHKTGDEALEDLAIAQKMILQLLGDHEDGSTSLYLADSVTLLLKVSYVVHAPKSDYLAPAGDDSVLYVNPPSEAKDYDDAYHEAKRVFISIFGEDEDFLIRNQEDEGEMDDE
jgi:hypothetical protein